MKNEFVEDKFVEVEFATFKFVTNALVVVAFVVDALVTKRFVLVALVNVELSKVLVVAVKLLAVNESENRADPEKVLVPENMELVTVGVEILGVDRKRLVLVP